VIEFIHEIYMYYVYILTNYNNDVMYIGVTNDLIRRLQEHRNGTASVFTRKYHVYKLVYYVCYSDPKSAIACEKKLKGWRREKKDKLVETMNPEWKDLSESWER